MRDYESKHIPRKSLSFLMKKRHLVADPDVTESEKSNAVRSQGHVLICKKRSNLMVIRRICSSDFIKIFKYKFSTGSLNNIIRR